MLDFTNQLSFNKNENVEQKIFNMLLHFSEERHCGDWLYASPLSFGSIIVIGHWDSHNPAECAMAQLKPTTNPVETYIDIDSPEIGSIVQEYSKYPYDGAIIFSTEGQLLGAGVYLAVTALDIEIPEGCGTRHLAAASFSNSGYVKSVLTLSEETNIVRMWKDGQCEQAYKNS